MALKSDYSSKRVVVTGIGPLCSLGVGRSEVWEAVLKGVPKLSKQRYRIGDDLWDEFFLHRLENFDIASFGLSRENFDFVKTLRTVHKEDTDLYYFLAVIKLALDDSKLAYDSGNNKIGLIISQENPGVEILFEELVDAAYALCAQKKGDVSKLELAKMLFDDPCERRGYNLQTFSYLFSAAKVFDFHGYSLFVNNACASGLFAIEQASQQIKAGLSPVVVAAAVDDPKRIYKYLWFKKRGLYAEDGNMSPFSKTSKGIVFGDGGAALVLEELDHALARKAHIYAEYRGGGFSLEGWKVTVPDISRDFYERSFRDALDRSGCSPADIDFVNPHGVGMRVTDLYEARTIRSIFGNRVPPTSAFKPLFGHNLGGSALLETAVALMSLEDSYIPPMVNCADIDDDLGLNIVTTGKRKVIHTIAKMSCGFAGFNGVSIFSNTM